MEYRTHIHETEEEFRERRRKFVGGSDIAKVVGVSKWGCPRSVAYDKLGHPKDFDNSDKAEFRRGKRLEGIAASYYEEKTGREVRITVTAHYPGKPHLAVNYDRLVRKEKDGPWGYLEIKVVGRWSMNLIKKEGLANDYVLQVQYGLGVKRDTWGSYAIYCPETDELLWWDVEADTGFGESLLEKADDFWNFHIELGILPDPLPEGAPQCEGCEWSLTCRGQVVLPASGGVMDRPDLESLLAKFAEVKGMGSEAEGAEEELKAEIREKIKDVPGTYRCGKYEFKFTVTSQNKFSSDLLKKKYPAIYEECRKETKVNTVYKPKEI